MNSGVTNRVGLMSIVLLGVAVGCATPQGETAGEKRDYIRDMKDRTLAELQKEKPAVEQELADAAGYAVFSNVNIKILAIGSGNGYGMAVDGTSSQETFMRMAEAGVGLGLGAKHIRTVFIFEQQELFDKFVDEGWSFGAEAAASAQSNEGGSSAAGEVNFEQGVKVYQLTESGLMASAMVSGTKYWEDNELK